jgi:hypothetical protein
MKVCLVPDSERARRYYLRTRIADVDGWMELDTGASETEIRADSEVGLKLQLKTSDGSAHLAQLGEISSAQRGRQSDISIGELTATIRPLLVSGKDNPQCPAMGVVGMDILRQCMILLDAETGFARCWQ